MPGRSLIRWIIVGCWLVTVMVLTSRIYFLLPYAARSTLPPQLEPFAITSTAMVVALAVASTWCMLYAYSTQATKAGFYLLIAALPGTAWLINLSNVVAIGPLFGEVLWLSGWTGLSFGSLIASVALPAKMDRAASRVSKSLTSLFWLLAVVCCVWWYSQQCWYFDNFLLGYNDYGHFLQRLSNTLLGQGLLIESPVLPRFWDHFNPGLLLLLPTWSIWPDVHQAFAWQAVALAGSAGLVCCIARAIGHPKPVAWLWGIAWLVQPAVGQMNLAYTYGWHPITFAIPLLLLTIWSLLQARYKTALFSCLLALSMEEGVFVIVSLTALWCGCYQLWQLRRSSGDKATPDSLSFAAALAPSRWLTIGLLTAIGFVVVYKTSGMAEFQTARFVKLGTSTTEILLSPIQKPAVFWLPFVSLDRWYYLSLLALPCGLPALYRGWQYLVPTLLPLAVLIVWDHLPAHCIAFQYASTLLPLFWLAAITGASSHPCAADHTISRRSATAHALTACVTGIVLSIFVGQLPYSQPTLMDVDGQTYGADDRPRRRADAEDGLWLTEQVERIREHRAPCLATGRIAAHLVHMPDIETVGQYSERKQMLSQLPQRSVPIQHYRWIVLDRRESFQQTQVQTQTIEAEALAAGFEVTDDRFDIVILKSRDASSQ